MKRDLKFERTYPYPPEVIWEAITDPESIGDWLMKNNFQPKVGHKFQFRDKPRFGWDGVAECEVLVVDQPRRLSYSWKGGPLDTVLSITLEPVAEGTRLVLEHTGFSGIAAVLVSSMMGKGWGKILDTKLPGVFEAIESARTA